MEHFEKGNLEPIRRKKQCQKTFERQIRLQIGQIGKTQMAFNLWRGKISYDC